MPIEILMPALSPTMTEGNLTKWLKKEGDEVHSGDVLAEIETDKATMEFEAVDDGRLGKILVPEGAQGIKVNQPIAVLLGEGEDAATIDKAPAAPTNFLAVAPQPATIQPPQAQPMLQREKSGNGRIFASPLARRMAQQAGLDLTAISGSGPQGRVVKSDIEAALSPGRIAPAAAPARAPQVPQPMPSVPVLSKERVAALAGNPPYTERPLNAMRRVIARRLTESKQTVPHFYLTIDCEIEALLKIRSELNAKMAAAATGPRPLPNPLPQGGEGRVGARGSERGGGISVNDFVIRAAALALRQVPGA